MKVCKINMLDVKGECMLYDCKCSEKKCSEWKSLTNYDRIKAMSVEEMAEFICGIFDIQPDDSKFINGDLIPMYDENEIRQWLESEVSE